MMLKRRGIAWGVVMVLLCLVETKHVVAQQNNNMGIGTINPDKSAILDISSQDKGLLPPRMSMQQRSLIPNPAEGLIVYQTDFLKGIYVYNGKEWSLVTDTEAKLVSSVGSWDITGNNNADSTNFIGTLNNAPLTFKVNNVFSGMVDSKRSNTFLGYKTGWTTKSFNSVVLGAYALQRASTGNDNVVIGYQSMFNHENGQYNVALGSLALSSSTTADKNTVLGAMAGYRSKGSSNVFIGFQAGYFEQGSDKLYINNNASNVPLIYGDFKEQFVGINTSTPANKLSIKGSRIGDSGLQFQSMTSTSPTKEGNGNVLSVDENGNVILVRSETGSSATGEATSEFWQSVSNGIRNSVDGNVTLTRDLYVAGTIESNRFEVADGGIVFKKINALTKPLSANGKALSVDSLGNIILVESSASAAQSDWQTIGNNLINKNIGKVFIKGDTTGSSGLQFQLMTSTSPTKEGNGNVLSVDETGNVILVRDETGSSATGGTASEFWQKSGNGIRNSIDGNVTLSKNLSVTETIESNRFEVADGGIVFKKINALTTPLSANGKALSLDNFGNIILVENTLPDTKDQWQIIDNNLINNNVGKVLIKNDLTIQAGKLKFDNLNSLSKTSVNNGKVLSLDLNGNVILTNDAVGNIDPIHWKKTGTRVELKEQGQLVIGTGITKLPDNFNLFVSKGILAERVRVAVPNSDKWADYVFKPNYQLMPLKEVESFILTYGHLPNVSSANEAAIEGMDVLEMSVKLLEKVEELTLYAIEANKRIEQLEAIVNKLEK